MLKNKQQAGFTIVELLIVIVVIGILAAITIVAYNGIQQRAAETTLRSDLSNAATAMGVACADTGDCPTTLPSSFKTSPDVGLSLSSVAAATSYCINGSHAKYPGMLLYYEQGKGIQSGTCSGPVITGSETGTVSKNLVLNTDFSSGWTFSRANGGNITPLTRPGASGDPNPNRPVLVVTNTPTTTGWSFLHGPIAATDIQAGKQYHLSFWARRTAGTLPTGGFIMVADGNTANKTLSESSGSFDGTWTKIEGTVTAAASGVSSNVLYIGISGANLITQGWTTEFQEISVSALQ